MKHITKKLSTSTVFSFILFCLIISCGSLKNTKANQAEIDKDPKIIFLTYSISQDENDKRSVQYVSQKTVDGRLKTRTSESIKNASTGDLICKQLGKNSKPLHTTLVKDPLNKTIEFIDESKKFQTKTINATKTQFSIRLQLKSNTKYITISNFADNHPLIKTKIN